MTLTFDQSTSRNRAPAPALTALVLSGLLTIVIADTQAAELAMITAQSEYGSPVSLSPEALPVRGTLDTSDLETDAQAIITRALRFQEGVTMILLPSSSRGPGRSQEFQTAYTTNRSYRLWSA